MRVLVCFKTTPIWERVLEGDWDRFSEHADLAYAGKQINCFDESTLELALRLKGALQENGQDTSCTAVTVGALPSSFAQALFAAGFDDVVSLGTDSVEFSPATVAAALTKYAAQGSFDLILTGKVAGMADTGQVPLLLAQTLSLPLVQDALDMKLYEGGIAVHCQGSNGVWERRIRTPLLVSVGNSPAVLRAVTLRVRLAAKNCEARTIPANIHGEDVSEQQFSRPISRRTCTFLSGDTDELSERLLVELRSDEQHIRSSVQPKAYPKNTIAYDIESIPWYAASNALKHLLSDWRKRRPDFALLSNTSLGRQLAAGLAAAVNGFLLTGASFTADGGVAKRVCASNLIWTQKPPLPAVLTIARFPPDAELISISADNTAPPAWLLGEEKVAPASETGLNNPHLVIVCGAGMGSRKNCDQARALAGRLRGGFGLTRMAALSGWGSPDEIVGQSGTSISPEVCLVLGASGAGAFVVGVENAGKVIAINTDREALIFKNADIGVATDAPALVAALLERGNSL